MEYAWTDWALVELGIKRGRRGERRLLFSRLPPCSIESLEKAREREKKKKNSPTFSFIYLS
jgi:hypothetical protein